ncbi:MAG TPA: isocitrate/isopropylmalate family dehydrogenase [Burkholderiales bacterium]|nr:isocitrate/isopropylmalate family dehydrogenase [Burkholderiales bacterium]
MRIVVMPGDDIGPEITAAALVALRAADRRFSLKLELQTVEVGMASYRKHGDTLTAAALEAALAAGGVILGPCGMSDYPAREEGGTNVPGTVRKHLDLFANLRPARFRPGVPRSREGLDLLIVRENTEGFYSDRNMHVGIAEFMPTPDVALSLRKVTREGSRRIAEVAFDWARRRRRRIAVVGKRHVLQLGDGLFVGEAQNLAAAHPQFELREVDVDAMAADLVMRPERYDVILTSNMFGDILSNEAVALSGGLGLAAALNVGKNHAVANAGHGSAPDIAGRNIANPAGLMLSCAMLLEWLADRHARPALREASGVLAAAIDRALADPAVRTGDLGGRGTTSGFGEAVASAL